MDTAVSMVAAARFACACVACLAGCRSACWLACSCACMCASRGLLIQSAWLAFVLCVHVREGTKEIRRSGR